MITQKNKFNPFLLRKFQKVAEDLSVAWDEITRKPATFPPDAHTHPEYIENTEKASSNGVATLDLNAKIPLSQLPDSILGQVKYMGLWAASTNTPTLPDPTTVKGHYYIASDAGTYNNLNFQTGDWIISDGINWTKVDNTDAVSSVFGRTGHITSQYGDYDYTQIAGLSTELAKYLLLTGGTLSGKLAIRTPNAIEEILFALGNNLIKDGLQFGVNADSFTFFVNALNARNLNFRTNQTSRFFITSDGKLGVGTTTPTEKLDVAGNIQFSGILKKSGNEFHKTTVSNTEPATKADGDRWIVPDPAETGTIQQVKDMLVYKTGVWYSLTGAAKYLGKIILTATDLLRAEGDCVSVAWNRTDFFFRMKLNSGIVGKNPDTDFTRIFEYAQNDVLNEDIYAKINYADYVKLAAGSNMPYPDANVASNNQSTYYINLIYGNILVPTSLASISSGQVEFYLASKNHKGSNSRLYFAIFPQTNVTLDRLNATRQQLFMAYVDNLVVGKNTITIDAAAISYMQANYPNNFSIAITYGGHSSLNENDYIMFDTTKDIKLILE